MQQNIKESYNVKTDLYSNAFSLFITENGGDWL